MCACGHLFGLLQSSHGSLCFCFLLGVKKHDFKILEKLSIFDKSSLKELLGRWLSQAA